MVSRYVDVDALGAISAASPFNDLIVGFSASVISGFSILAGRIFGSGDLQRLRNVMANVVYISVILVGVATVVCAVFCRTFVVMMNTPAGFVDMATVYLFITVLSMPISAISWVYSGMFRALGDSRTPLTISIISGASNVVFNFFFLGILDMGIEGAAYGTVCAIALGAGLYLYFLKTRMKVLHFGREDASFSWIITKILLSNGIPLGLLNGVIAVGALILQVAVNGHGEDVVTGIATGGRVLTILWMIFLNFESAIIYFCAQNLGAHRVDRVRSGVRNTLLLNLALGGVCAVVAVFFGKYVYMLFVGNETGIINVAQEYLTSQVIFFPLMVTLCAWRGGLKGLGSTVPSVLCGVIELVSRAVICTFFADNLRLLYMAGPLAWIGATIFLAILYPRTLKRMERQFACEKQAEEAIEKQIVPEQEIPNR